jgi:hypothetical protein
MDGLALRLGHDLPGELVAKQLATVGAIILGPPQTPELGRGLAEPCR